jgi:hypothetical protein
MRTGNAYLILGQKDKALRILNYFLTLTRPKTWNHWGEVVYFNYREPKYLGDMPHSWEGAIYVNFVRNLFIYEKDDRLILGAGIDEAWLSGEKGVSIKHLPTYSGNINYTIQKKDNIVKFKISGDLTQPPKAFIFKSPLLAKVKEVELNGEKRTGFKDDEITFSNFPAEMVIKY